MVIPGFLLAGNHKSAAQATAAGRPSYERIKIIGEAANKGVFDPAIEYNTDGAVGWMIYSALESPVDTPANVPIPKYVHTHLARTTDGGKTWTFVGRINESVEDTVVLKGRTISGVWWHEVPTLVHDPDDRGREWKLFWHKYFAIPKFYFDFPVLPKLNLLRIKEYMWIACKAAASPEELAAAEETALFGSGQFPLPPYGAVHDLDKLHPDLRKNNWYSEPGSLYKGGVLYLSLSGGAVGDVRRHRTFLLSSHDHGRTWQYTRMLTDARDASDYGCKILTGSSLVEEKDRVYLLISPVGHNGMYRGAYIFAFDDIGRGTLRRDDHGKLIPIKYLKRSLFGPWHAGQGDYDEHNVYGGIVIPQADVFSAPAMGQIFSTRQRIF